jgi:signal transduction histidine kinase
MATLALALAMLRDRAGGDAAMAASLDRAAAELKQAIAELRELARGIHPAILTEEGLPAAVEALADRSAPPGVSRCAATRLRCDRRCVDVLVESAGAVEARRER